MDLQKLEQKTYNEFSIDGITEVFIGIILILIPLMFIFPVFAVFIAFAPVYGQYLIDKVREKTTYPRIGRVEFKLGIDKEGYNVPKTIIELFVFLSITVIITALVMFIVEGKILDMGDWYKWVPFLFGLIMFGPSFELIEKTGKKYYILFGILGTFFGFIMSVFTFPNVIDGMFLYFIIFGISIELIGIFRYYLFIKKYNIIETEEKGL